ncbi:MAG: lysylphosphatidylglycerol synthase transmembrane domain-containing protein, partial [Bacilli bacterium]
PGAVGASESAFMLVFRTFFPVVVLTSAMFMTRLLSFYVVLFVSGVFLFVLHIIVHARKQRRVQPVR